MKPTVGRTVHYEPVESAAGPLAAIVAGVNPEGTVNLWIFPRYDCGSLLFRESVPETPAASGEPFSGCWNWPPRATGDVPERPLPAVAAKHVTGLRPVHEVIVHVPPRPRTIAPTEDEWDELMIVLGYAAGAASREGDSRTHAMALRTVNAVNRSVLGWIPHAVPEAKP